jgi:hypothetical protein
MPAESDRFFLTVGMAWNSDAAADKAKASGITVRRKSFFSSLENWKTIQQLLEDPKLLGCVIKFTRQTYNVVDGADQELTRGLFSALATIPHVVFIHESILSERATGSSSRDEGPREQVAMPYSGPPDLTDALPWRPLTAEAYSFVNGLMTQHDINIVPYKTNAELSVLATAFIEDNERNLLFRVYVPSGRLYAAEGERIVSLFLDWLSKVGKHGIRQDGYKTAAGQVYEFFGDESLRRDELSREFDNFSSFLTSCAETPDVAAATLSAAGMSRATAESMVARYGKELRRLELDLRQEGESRLLAIRHGLEADLLDYGSSSELPWVEINQILKSLMPEVGSPSPSHLLALPASHQSTPLNLNYNQQIIHAVHGNVIQNIQGTAHLGSSARELMGLISQFGGNAAPELESAVHEFEDTDARPADRLNARQKLKAFLFQLGTKVQGTALAALQSYLEAKLKSAL